MGLQWRPIVNRLTLAVLTLLISVGTAAAQTADQLPQPSFPVRWQLNLQNPASPVMERMVDFHNLLLVIITAISLFVLALLLICMFRFNERANPVPSKTSHNTLIEVIWTGIPVLILIGIAIPSYRLLFFADRVENAEMTLKITGNQWYWSYEYPDSEISFDSLALPDDKIDTAKGQHRLLEVDNPVFLPVDTPVRLLFTATDVIHAWTIPAFGVKTDTVPGRTNESWVRATKIGKFYGQCSELCGVDHSYMPIVVNVVSKEEFKQWLASKKQASAEPTTRLASAQ
jgi:cytochrome c oxidase subunit 2